MENATKALLIAAAVLVAIMVIGLGLMIFNKASESASGAGDLSEYETQQFNEKFLKYNSTSASGSDVNALLRTVFNHNNAQPDTGSCVSVTVDGTNRIANSNTLTAAPNPVSTGSRYTIACTIGNNKLVTSIAITTNT